MKVSIIVPIYNSADFLVECLDSIRLQTFKDYEVLCINDGSTDNSLEICTEFAQKDNRFKPYSQTNQGVSATRNNGIKYSKGDYIVFIDSDDIIDPNYLEELIKLSDDTHELSVGHYCRNINALGNNVEEVSGYYSLARESYISKLINKKIQFSTICCMLFKRSIIVDNDIKFDCNIYWGEDSLFYYEYMSKMEGNIHITPKALYYYRDNVKSAMNSINPSKAITAVESSRKTERVLVSSGLLQKEDATIVAESVLKLMYLSLKNNNWDLYNLVNSSLDVPSYMKDLFRKTKVIRVKLGALLYLILGEEFFFKALSIVYRKS